MVAECCGTGALSKLAIGPTGGTISRMDFIQFTPKIVKAFSDGTRRAIRGTLDMQSTGIAEGQLHVRFRTSFYMTPQKMDVLLPCLGFTNSGTTWTLVDAIPDSDIVVGPAGANEDTYHNCQPTDFSILGTKGTEPVKIDIGWVGKTWTNAAAGTFFTNQSTPPLIEGYVLPFNPSTGAGNSAQLTLGAPYSQILAMPQVQFSVDYGTIVEFNNSTFATNICPSIHDIRVGTSCLYTICDGNATLFTDPLGGDVLGSSFSWFLERTVSATQYSTQIVLANAKIMGQSYVIRKSDINRLPLQFSGYLSGSSPALRIINIP